MAARLNKLHQADVRLKIQTSQLLNVLQKHAVEGIKDFEPSRLKAIEILLKKSLPDLSSVEITGQDGGPLVVQVVRYADDPAT